MSWFGNAKLKEELAAVKAELLVVKRQRNKLKAALDTVRRPEYDMQRHLDEMAQQKEMLAAQIEIMQSKANQKIREMEVIQADLIHDIAQKRQEVIILNDEILLQSFGFYEARYDFISSELYKQELDKIRKQQAKMVKEKTATHHNTGWMVNNSQKEGEKLIKDYVKLILRTFNIEVDASISGIKFNNITSIEKKINKAFEDLNRLGAIMSISISQAYLKLKIQELYLCYEYQVKKQEEKEEQQRIRQQMREEAKVLKEIEAAKAKIEKEEQHFIQALNAIKTRIDRADATELDALLNEKSKIEEKLNEVQDDLNQVEARERSTRAGYVYIISNIGSFGEGVYKIGVTRRLDPQERVDELGDASVPFYFDVHAMIFTDDAPSLETALHRTFDHKRLNKINRRREFFRVSLDEIEAVVRNNFDKPVDFIRVPSADQYRQSLALSAAQEQEMAQIA